jgi:hypothetical protein
VASFPKDVLADLAEREVVYIETAAPKRPDGRRRTIIWVIVDGNDVFVRSVRGERGRWYRELLAKPEATIHFRGKPKRDPVRASAVHAPDKRAIDRINRALEAKYGNDPSLKSMLEPETLATNFRLEPI